MWGHRWAVISRAPSGSSLHLLHIGCNPIPNLLGEETIVLLSLVQAPSQRMLNLQEIRCTRKHFLGLSPCFSFDAVFVCEKMLCRRILLTLNNNYYYYYRMTSRTTMLCIGREVRDLVLWELFKSSVVLLVWLSNIPTTSCNRKN